MSTRICIDHTSRPIVWGGTTVILDTELCIDSGARDGDTAVVAWLGPESGQVRWLRGTIDHVAGCRWYLNNTKRD